MAAEPGRGGAAPVRALAGRRALVTGAGSGIGRASALALAEAGAEIVVQDIVAERVEAVAAEIRAKGGKATGAAFNVADEDAMRNAVAAAGGPVTLLLNNAGIAGGNVEFEKVDRAAYMRMFDIHVWGSLNAVRAVLPGMKAERFGRIVNIASNRGQVGFERSCHYSGAKAALMGFAKAWAREFAPWNILVNAIAPGVIRTAMTLSFGEQAVHDEAQLNLLKRWGEPEEIAAWVRFLMEPTGNFTTGQLLCPNGGDPIVGI
jgi:3-oxoacyl-[acyl-carrier protein] reductase